MVVRKMQLPLVAFTLVASSVGASVPSGPTPGENVPTLRVFVAAGPRKDAELDFPRVRQEKTTVYVLIREWDRPTARYLKALDGMLRADSTEAEVVAVWLTGDRDETKRYLPRAQESLRFEHTNLAVFLGESGVPDGWNVNPSARVTTVVAGGGKVKRAFGYGSLNETDVTPVREAVRKAAEE